MTSRPLGLFDLEMRQRELEALGDALVELTRMVPWEMFRETLETMRPQRDPRRGGRPPHDALRLFNVLVLRELFTLSDAQVEFQIAERLSFQRFLGIDLTQDAPDYTAIWRFRERLGLERMQALFAELNGYIDLAGFEVRKGQMIDASIVQKPKTRQPAASKGDAPAGGTSGWRGQLDAEARTVVVRLQEPRQRRCRTRLHPRLRGDTGGHPRLAGAAGVAGHHLAWPAGLRRLGLPFGGDAASLPRLWIDQPGAAQGAAQPSADGDAEAYQSSLGEDARARRARVRAHRPISQGQAAALHGAASGQGGDRPDPLRPQPASLGDDASASLGAGEWMMMHTGSVRLARGKSGFGTTRPSPAATRASIDHATPSVRRHAASSKQDLQTAPLSGCRKGLFL